MLHTIRFFIGLFGFILLVLVHTSCAPSNAKAIREDRSLTIGLPGASYRPTGSFGIGTTVNGVGRTKKEVTIEREDDNGTAMTSDDKTVERDIEIQRSYTTVTPFVQIFPWDTSAFFIGLASSFTSSHYQYGEESLQSTASNPAYTDVSYSEHTVHVGIPVGWSWIWANGFSLNLDIGPKFRVSRAVSYNENGADEGVDEEKRDDNVEAISKYYNPAFSLSASTMMIGYSF